MHSFRDLRVWSAARELVVLVYEVTRSFPVEERFGLAAQMRRSAVSIPSNIAEGCGRSSQKDFARFLSLSAGSTSELEAQVDISEALGYIDKAHSDLLTARSATVRRMLWGLRRNALDRPTDAKGRTTDD